MPEKDGLETVKEILAIDTKAVIFTVSGKDEDYQEVAKRLGAKRGFEKPVMVEQFLRVIASLRSELEII